MSSHYDECLRCDPRQKRVFSGVVGGCCHLALPYRTKPPVEGLRGIQNTLAPMGEDTAPGTDGGTDGSSTSLQGLLSLRPALKQKIVDWLISFYHLDPRYQILTYFNEVAREGGDNLLDEGDEYDSEDIMVRRRRSFSKIEKLVKEVFKTTSILTVWRPTTNDAMRLMMEGKGVGKGLDIKGKSARGGKLSGYVPFLQIHEEGDKQNVSYIHRKAKLRVYFDSREAREQVMDELEPLGNDYMCFDKDIVIHSEMIEIDNFAGCGKYGIELSQRLFWEGFVKHRDISRPPELRTGRASLPGFQDANLHALKFGCEHPGTEHVPVVYQLCSEDPMDSLHLVMAYEENGVVTPVVSDFDGFLLGWKREALWFGCQLPREQEDLMLWCVDQIEEILDSPISAESWTVRWLEILKKESTPHPEIPHYGFGDPKSYGIMERAALQLSKSGAVRHGSECFNYYFPQEIDDTFLVVSDTFKGVPWRYVNVRQLQGVLSQLIKDGFVFPLHPKWILCDPGWKDLYDSLMASNALYAEYTKDVWYPRFSGIRDKIERIHKKHPFGFQRLRTDTPVGHEGEKYSPLRQSLELRDKLSGNALSELAEIEYEAYSAKIAKQKRRASMTNGVGGIVDDEDSDDDSLDGDAYQTSVSVQRFVSSSEKASSSDTPLLQAPFPPAGDQQQAIDRICTHFNENPSNTCAILRGITGTGKTLVMAHTIARLQRNALVLCHNKTLAAQLARELRSFLGSAELFVSFYNSYRPESYIESTDTYVSKRSSINGDIDALRHRATRALLSPPNGSPVVVVASVSCIYGLGMPSDYVDATLQLQVDDAPQVEEGWISTLTQRLMYSHVNTEEDFEPGSFQLFQWENKSDDTFTEQIVLWAPHERFPWRITSKQQKIVSLEVGHDKGFDSVSELTVFPAKHHVMAPERKELACQAIEQELEEQVKVLRAEKKHIEAERLQQRVYNDVAMIRETGFCNGVENYSRHLAGRAAGVPPETLLNYMPSDDWLLIVDESHVTLPQLKAMYGGDQARKRMLVKHGYRLPSALDNRPLQASEFWDKVKGNTLFVSATPGSEETKRAHSEEAPVVDMIIRPTHVCDPVIELRSPDGQLENLHAEISQRAQKGERSLVITLSKQDAEDLSSYLNEHGIKATFIHSGLKTHARSQALQALQTGEVDCLVGINCLREGIDLPQVSLVAVLQADVEGFLRSETALLQIVGRAARNQNGRAIFYARRVTDAMKACMESTAERRRIQLEYNEKNGCEMRTTKGSSAMSIFDLLKDQIEEERSFDLSVGRASSSRNAATATDGLIEGAISVPVQPKGRENFDTDHIPSSPGVYFWKDESEEILYIGKAVRLRSRVKSYLTPSAKHSHRIRTMLDKACSVDFILTPSERDALVLESNLIKQHQPPFNVLLKDDEHYPYICASVGDSLPRFSIVPRPPLRGEINTRHRYFGPYTSFREINAILGSIEDEYDLRAKAFLVRHGSASKEEYRNTFDAALAHVLGETKGRNQTDIQKARSEYEEAGMLFGSPYNECRDVVTIIEADEKGQDSLVHVVQLRQGIVAGQFSYQTRIAYGRSDDEDLAEALQTVLEKKHYPSGREAPMEGFSWYPDSILMSHAVVDEKQLRTSVRQSRKEVEPRRSSKLEILTAATRGGRREVDARALDFCNKNAMLVVKQKNLESQRGSAVSSLDGRGAEELGKLLSLKDPLKRIECYDISHTQGESAVGSRVVFLDGKPAPHLYRKFNIQTVDGVDDYASIQEVLERRFRRSWVNGAGGQVDAKDPWSVPDLVVIDGGRGQLNAAIKGMSKAMVYPSETSSDPDAPRSAVVPICSLAKDKEEVFVPGSSTPVNQTPDSPALLMLRALRDESHRFALKAHRNRRSLTK